MLSVNLRSLPVKTGDLVLVRPYLSHDWVHGIILAINVLDWSGDMDPWTSYKVLIGDRVTVCTPGNIRSFNQEP